VDGIVTQNVGTVVKSDTMEHTEYMSVILLQMQDPVRWATETGGSSVSSDLGIAYTQYTLHLVMAVRHIAILA
jgi:hypothetical protein